MKLSQLVAPMTLTSTYLLMTLLIYVSRRQPPQILVQVFTGQILFLSPNQQYKALTLADTQITQTHRQSCRRHWSLYPCSGDHQHTQWWRQPN